MSGVPVLEVLVSTRPGGGPRHVAMLATGLRQRGFVPIIAGPRDGAMFDRFRATGLDVVELRSDRLGITPLRTLVALIRARGIRVVHSHGKGAGLYARLAARLTGIAAIHTFHGIHFERYAPLLRAVYLELERRLSRWTHAIVNVSASQEAEGLALGLFARAQSSVIPNGVDVEALGIGAFDRATARAALGVGASASVVGCAARFDPVKGLDRLVGAAALVSAATLVVIGEGPQAAHLRAAAATAGLGERARWPGEIPDAWRFFPAFDVYASTSVKEGLPFAVLEAMALGVPVVATRIPAHEEVLGEDSPGLTDHTPEAVGTALLKLLADNNLRTALAAANRARVRERFGAERMVDDHERLYCALLNSATPRDSVVIGLSGESTGGTRVPDRVIPLVSLSAPRLA